VAIISTPEGTIIFEAGFALPTILTEGGVRPTTNDTPVSRVGTVAPAVRSLENTLVPKICAFTIAAT
jgi:hypothetical protein